MRGRKGEPGGSGNLTFAAGVPLGANLLPQRLQRVALQRDRLSHLVDTSGQLADEPCLLEMPLEQGGANFIRPAGNAFHLPPARFHL